MIDNVATQAAPVARQIGAKAAELAAAAADRAGPFAIGRGRDRRCERAARRQPRHVGGRPAEQGRFAETAPIRPTRRAAPRRRRGRARDDAAEAAADAARAGRDGVGRAPAGRGRPAGAGRPARHPAILSRHERPPDRPPR